MSEQEKKDQEIEQDLNAEANEEQKNGTDEQELSAEEKAEAKFNEVNEKYLRLYSEFENFRKRTQKEKVDLYKTAGEDVIGAILPVLDDFERAQKAIEDAEEVSGVKDGVKLIHDKIVSILKQKGLEEIASPVNESFDIELHEAITQIPAPNKKQIGKVIDQVEKGYKLNGKVIRYAKVVVGK